MKKKYKRIGLPKPYYQTELGTLYCGDCLEIMPYLEKVDLVLTDPPYGKTQNKWDNLEITISAFDLLMPNNFVFTCQQPSTSILVSRYLKYFKWADIWYKSCSTGHLNCKVMPLRQHEDILVFGVSKVIYNPQITTKPMSDRRSGSEKRGATFCYGKFSAEAARTINSTESYPRSIYYCSNSQKNGIHPNEKPENLFQYLALTFSNVGSNLLDPFLGSGTTAVVCERLGRRWVGIEKIKEYCEVAKQRLEKEVQVHERGKIIRGILK